MKNMTEETRGNIVQMEKKKKKLKKKVCYCAREQNVEESGKEKRGSAAVKKAAEPLDQW